MLKLAMFATAIAVGGALSLAAPAHADQYDFVSALDNQGIYYSSISDMIDTGKAVCTIVRRTGNSNPAIAGLTRMGYASGHERGVIIVAAANNMCPDIWPALNEHAREVMSPPPPPPPPADDAPPPPADNGPGPVV